MSVVKFIAQSLLFTLLLTGCERAGLTDAEGNAFALEDFHGRWLVVNYWAEWCKPCLEEIPELNSLHRAHQERDAVVLGINFDRPEPSELLRQMEALGVAFPVVQSDPQQQLDYLIPQVLPTTYLFDRQGKLAHTLVGPQTQASIESYIQAQ